MPNANMPKYVQDNLNYKTILQLLLYATWKRVIIKMPTWLLWLTENDSQKKNRPTIILCCCFMKVLSIKFYTSTLATC